MIHPIDRDIIFAAQLTAWALATPDGDPTLLHFEAHMVAILAVAGRVDLETITNARQDRSIADLEFALDESMTALRRHVNHMVAELKQQFQQELDAQAQATLEACAGDSWALRARRAALV